MWTGHLKAPCSNNQGKGGKFLRSRAWSIFWTYKHLVLYHLGVLQHSHECLYFMEIIQASSGCCYTCAVRNYIVSPYLWFTHEVLACVCQTQLTSLVKWLQVFLSICFSFHKAFQNGHNEVLQHLVLTSHVGRYSSLLTHKSFC